MMWPFGSGKKESPREAVAKLRRQGKIAESVIEEMRGLSTMFARPIYDAWKDDHLTHGEYHALLFPILAPYSMATEFFGNEISPFKNLQGHDLQDEHQRIRVHILIQHTFFFVLRELMQNVPELAEAIGTSHEELIRKYATISITGTETAQEIEDSLARFDKLVQESGGDPRPVWDSNTVIFLQGIIERPFASEEPRLTEGLMCSAVASDVMAHLARRLREALGVPRN
jgi:hypothetical protein